MQGYSLVMLVVFSSMSINSQGEGYDQEFEVSIEPSIVGAPGQGIILDLIDGSFARGVYDWGGNYNVLSAGTNYLQNLNQLGSSESFSISTGTESSITVRTGDVIVSNINYGTGERQVDIEGDWESPPEPNE